MTGWQSGGVQGEGTGHQSSGGVGGGRVEGRWEAVVASVVGVEGGE